MPTDTILALIPITGAFVFFAAVVAYADMTWRPRR